MLAIGKKLGLGTVQWGAEYGISNRVGRTHLSEVGLILDRARKCGVVVIDTAPLYGNAESVLGAHSLSTFRIITKTPRFHAGKIDATYAIRLRETFDKSLSNLGLRVVDGLLVHGANDLLVPGGRRLFDEMQLLKSEGLVRKIGVSVYDDQELDAILALGTPDIVQLPANVFDQRLLNSGHLRRLKDEGIEIHVRSVFLQGLLLMPEESVPQYFAPIMNLLSRWHSATREQSMTPIQAALSFIRDIPEVDTVLVGVESVSQFEEILDSFAVTRSFNASGLSCDDIRFINPGLWNLES